MATLAELRTRIQRGFGDENQAVIVTAEIDDLINEAIREISKMLEMNSTTTTITTTDADGRIAVPSDFMKVKEIRYNGLILPMIPRSVVLARYNEYTIGETSVMTSKKVGCDSNRCYGLHLIKTTSPTNNPLLVNVDVNCILQFIILDGRSVPSQVVHTTELFDDDRGSSHR